MRKLFLLALLAISLSSVAQVGIGTPTPNTSAQLDVTSTTKGFLPPRLTEAQRIGIASPVAGLMIWCRNCDSSGQLQVYNGTTWTNMIGGAASVYTPVAIGDAYKGGKCAYLLVFGDPGYDPDIQHGLIAALSDQTSAEWGCWGTTISGADGTALGTGLQNTIDIMAGCATAAIAARQCSGVTINGYSDWYLPSKDELNKLYLNRVAIGGFLPSGWYFSSSEGTANYAWHQDFSDGSQAIDWKDWSLSVRAVRSF